jgi:hypothetical protein
MGVGTCQQPLVVGRNMEQERWEDNGGGYVDCGHPSVEIMYNYYSPMSLVRCMYVRI